LGSSDSHQAPFGGNSVSQPVAFNTSVNEFVSLSLTCSAATAGNSLSVQQMIAEELTNSGSL
jgi:hypothetical protein